MTKQYRNSNLENYVHTKHDYSTRFNAVEESKSLIFHSTSTVTPGTEPQPIQTSASLNLDEFLLCTLCDP